MCKCFKNHKKQLTYERLLNLLLFVTGHEAKTLKKSGELKKYILNMYFRLNISFSDPFVFVKLERVENFSHMNVGYLKVSVHIWRVHPDPLPSLKATGDTE